MGIAEEFGVGQPLRLSGIVGGEKKEIVLSLGRFNLSVMAAFASWAQDVVIERARKLAGAMHEDVRNAAICRAVDIVTKEADWGGPVCDSLAKSPTGIAKMIHLLLDPDQQKKVPISEILAMLDPDKSDEIQYAMFKAAGVSDKKIAEMGVPIPPAAATQKASTGQP